MSNTDELCAAAQQALVAMEKYPVTVNHWKAVLLPAADALHIADGYSARPYGDGYIIHHESGGAWAADLAMVAAVLEIARLRAADDAHRAAFAAIYTALQPADPDRATWPAEIARLRAMLAAVIVGNRTS